MFTGRINLSKKPRAVRLHFVLPAVDDGAGVTITQSDQPYPCAAPSLLVGLHGSNMNFALQMAYPGLMHDAMLRSRARVQLRPRPDQIDAGQLDGGLHGMRYFHAATSPTQARAMLSHVWREAAEARAEKQGERMPRGIQWNVPESYMCKCPQVVADVFMRLPNLDVMVAFTEVRKSVMAVAIAPISNSSSWQSGVMKIVEKSGSGSAELLTERPSIFCCPRHRLPCLLRSRRWSGTNVTSGVSIP